MKFGDSGEVVQELQTSLTNLGFPLVADGQFGAQTESAVKAFQKAHGLNVDGVAGPFTLHYINALEASVNAPSNPKGADTSHWDGKVDWEQFKKDGLQFVSMKCTEGLYDIDPNFKNDWLAAKAAGVMRAAYHFFHPNMGGFSQAVFFLSTMGELLANDLPPCIDMEQMNGVSPAEALKEILAFLQYVQIRSKKCPIFYTNPDIMNQLGHPAELLAYPLWLAAPGHTLANVTVPKPWSKVTILQSSFTGQVAGIPSKNVDLDIFNGSLAELNALASGVV
jgi:lysozyme